MTSQEVADNIDRSRALVLVWCRAGRLPGAVRVGRDWQIPESALDVLRARNLTPGRVRKHAKPASGVRYTMVAVPRIG